MDKTAIVEEYNFFISLAKDLQNVTDICTQDVEQLKDVYPNKEIVKNVRNSFLSLYFSGEI